MIVKNQKNLKVHFAGAENIPNLKCCLLFDVNYLLYTAFPFVERKIFKTGNFPIMPCEVGKENIPKFVFNNSRHSIQDSGLFSLMFGSRKGLEKSIVSKWYHGLVEHTLESNFKGTCVEVDCQKILGVEKAWEFRKRIKEDLPNNRIINVFHKEDGLKGLDRLIEFSDYIAISIPELRKLGKKQYTLKIASYIKNKKPDIDIHLLGCTEKKMLRELKFCSSSDSTSWISPSRYGYVLGNKVSTIDTNKVINNLLKDKDLSNVLKWRSDENLSMLSISILNCLNEYNNYAGSQD